MIYELKNLKHAAPNSILKIAFCETCGEIYRAKSTIRLREELAIHVERTKHKGNIRHAPPFPK